MVWNIYLYSDSPHVKVSVVQILHRAPVPICVRVEQKPLQYTALPDSLSSQDDQSNAFVVTHGGTEELCDVTTVVIRSKELLRTDYIKLTFLTVGSEGVNFFLQNFNFICINFTIF